MIETAISIAFWVSSCLTLLIIALPSQYIPRRVRQETGGNGKEKVTVQILVLGDIGRSPRMQYHALSIARHGGQVDIIGYQESDPHPEITSHSNITVVPLPPHPAILQTNNKIVFLVFGPLKVLFQILSLWICLAYRTKPAKYLLVQNPPSIPTLAIASVVCFLRQTRLIIDWHNFGYSILSLKLGNRHPLVVISKWYEKFFCGWATAHFCVTNAMTRILKDDFQITKAPILTLHDRPASHFKPILDEEERTQFLASLKEVAATEAELATGDVRVLVSSTSWTPDEDFSVLIDALCRYSEIATTENTALPSILAIITGKGPQKEMYLNEISARAQAGKLEKVDIRTAWLSTLDYAKLLGSASLGVSLHTSSSGVDLPMKVVDMFGAGLPVVGWNRFEAWPELVTEGVNGRGFGSSEELASHLTDLFGNLSKLENLRNGAQKESLRRWDQEWDPIAGRLLGVT
ncbi:beta-1,4-mannosyltransferase (Alg1), putative [Talaromyces stipitatus ATCC 10500]|uniref:Chitobiosyldiphosphodolichol beta-mannosyltransferase n=1 Tax=Talaromyces stipitatus (strain ATCC 10500 / CBS 375.48 / QM 6759 / NRRL 1006) TaxID=441959 RepID=B8M665_TALSN|nr:beta-1,4-mannosyltransferase (Alg1), putative [Talaromyces stipitatus ATCC 10500]EED19065.1 beta-1,4-mannosyltransferase (Alg1), putative [Talaromyces stipitatus ATCC 10500]